MAFPQNTCVTGKRVYTSQETAEDALIETWTRFVYGPGSGPIAIYRCDDCGYYHFTSKGPMNENLARAIKEGRIDRGREAKWWEDKLGH